MSHRTGTVQVIAPILIGPDTLAPPTTPPDTWALDFAHTPAPGGTKLVMLHFVNASFPANNRLEVDLGYGTDVFTAADGASFWTRPINIHVLPGGLIPVRYVTDGAATGGVQIDRYGRGEPLASNTFGHDSITNSDPFLPGGAYTEPPKYDKFWYCVDPPVWENVGCIPSAADIRARTARSVGMIVSVEGSEVSTCTVTLIDADIVICAGHCHTPAEALTSSVTFDYQTECDGSAPGYSARFYKVKAVVKHRHDGNFVGAHDYSILQLAEAPVGVPVVQLRHDLPAVGEQVFGIHHPNGAVKKLSLPHDPFATILTTSTTSIMVPTTFHVSGGSSGSGLFDTAGRYVGVLSIGDPCGNTGMAFNLSYFPSPAILADIVPAPPPPVSRDVVVVFDRSGSMSESDGAGRTKIEAARDAVSLFVQLVKTAAGNRVGLVSFSSTAGVDAAIGLVTNGSKPTLIGPAPYSGGKVGALSPGGATSIGEGLDAGRLQFPDPGANPRAILLLTDGMQNTPRWVDQVDDALGEIAVHAIGFGTEATLDGDLLTTLAAEHDGLYMRAGNGLALEKFFSQAFGNIFAAGILMDPEHALAADQRRGEPLTFSVCGEESLTVAVGWDRTDAALQVEVRTPGGATLTAGSAGVEAASGRTWTFLRVPLPHAGERDGAWTATVTRPGGGGEFPPAMPALRYFVNVIPTGGPRLVRAPDRRRYYTGDELRPLLMLRSADGGWPENGQVRVTVSRPTAGAGNLLSRAGLGAPAAVDGDTIPARQATLAALERKAGGPLVQYTEETFDLTSGSADLNGAFEPAGSFGGRLRDHLTMEGSYAFHARASYGEECAGTRELLWSLHVDVGIDPARTEVTATFGGGSGGGRDATLVLVPRDRYGNQVGPGRLDGLTFSGAPGSTVTGPAVDNGDGSYTVGVRWDGASGDGPGVSIGQPGRPPVVVGAPSGPEPARPHRKPGCWLALLAPVILLVLFLLVYR